MILPTQEAALDAQLVRCRCSQAELPICTNGPSLPKLSPDPTEKHRPKLFANLFRDIRKGIMHVSKVSGDLQCPPAKVASDNKST